MKISNTIVADKTKELMDYCKENLILDNPEYQKKERMGLWLGNTPKKLHLYEIRQDKIILPFGELKSIWHIIKNYNIETEFSNIKVDIKGEISLYDYQERALKECLKAKNGVLVSPAGSGKTQMAIALIKELGLKALWLTHTKDLLSQSKDRFEAYFKCRVGTITAGKIDIGDVTFATVQTMSKLDLRSLEDEFSVIIVDECHRLSSTPTKLTMFGKVVNSLKARYKFGITATAHRADNMIRSLYAYLGDIFYEVPKSAVADKTIKAKVVKRDTKFILEPYADCIDSDGTLNFTKFISELCEDEERNRMIAEDIKSNKGKSCIVLSQRLGQLEQIKEMVGEGVMIHGKMTTKKGKLEREQAIQDMREGKQKILYASYNLAKEGLDVPRLNRLFLASPQKDKAVIIQSVGRIERKCLKEEPIVYDYVDNLGITLGMWKKRRAIYNKNNNEVMG